MHVQSTTDTGLKVCVCFDYINTEPYTQIVGLDVIVVKMSVFTSSPQVCSPTITSSTSISNVRTPWTSLPWRR